MDAELALRLRASLSPDGRRALAYFCQMHDLPPERWWLVPALVNLVEGAALAEEVARIRREPGPRRSERSYELAACERLGLKPTAVLKRKERWWLLSRQDVAVSQGQGDATGELIRCSVAPRPGGTTT